MSFDNTKRQIFSVCEFIKENRLNEAADLLKSVNTDEVLSSVNINASLIFIEKRATDLIQDFLNGSDTNCTNASVFVEQVGWFNQSISTRDTTDEKQIKTQIEILFNADVLRTLTKSVDALRSNDHFHRHGFVASLCIWLESIGHFIYRHENTIKEPVDPLRESLLSCVLSDWYRKYLTPSTEINITARPFFIRTCSFVTGVLQNNQISFEGALQTIKSYQIVETIGQRVLNVRLNDFRQYLLQLKDQKADLKCLTGVCLLITNCYNVKTFVGDREYFEVLLNLLKSDFVRENLLPTWTNDNTILASTLMTQLKNSSNESAIQSYLQQSGGVNVAKDYMYASYARLRLQSCLLLGVLLDNESIRQLNIPAKDLTDLYFEAIQQAHQSSSKSYKRVPIHLLLRALSSLAHNSMIQAILAESDEHFSYLISRSDDYNIVYDILWTLSFDPKFHEKFHSHKTLIERLQKFVNDPSSIFDKDVLIAAEGILWNLNNKNQSKSTSAISTQVEQKADPSENVKSQSLPNENYKFDTMISYCWKEKTICKQIFDRLTDKGYRVWFDEKNMHGNSVKAMANAIEASKCIILCMSTNYQRSNACHHEADYAYVLNRHIVPLVVQPGYKARDWLGFIIGSRIYVDFTKHEFDAAFPMLETEIKLEHSMIDDRRTKATLKSESNNDASLEVISTAYEKKPVKDWLSIDVVSWCRTVQLPSFAKLFRDFDGPCLMRLYTMSKKDGDDATFRSLKADFQNHSDNSEKNLSYTEFIRFQSELEKLMMKNTNRSKSSTVKKSTGCSLF